MTHYNCSWALTRSRFFFSRSALAKEVDALQDELLRRDIEFETATSQIMADYETLYSEKLARSKETLRVELEASSRAERGIAIEAAKKEARGRRKQTWQQR